VRPRRAILILVLAVILAGLVSAYGPEPSLVASLSASDDRAAALLNLPWLNVQRHSIVDQDGRRVLLHGFDVDALVSFPNNPPAPVDEHDAGLMQAAGFDVVRLGIDWAQLEPKRGRIDQTYLDRVASTVEMLNRHGLYVVLDMHFRLGFSPAFGYSGAPSWARIASVPNWNPLPQFSWSPALSPAAFTADTYFWLFNDWKSDFYLAWKAVATRFRDVSGVAGYDIINEPHPLPIPPRIFERSFMWPMYQQAIQAIGSVDPNHIFFVEGILLLTLNTAMAKLSAPNLVYATHVYEGSLVPPFWTGDPAPLRERFKQRSKEADELGAPLWFGEMGYDLTQAGALSYADAVLDDADQLHSGWAWWQWRENKYWGIVDRGGRLVNFSALRHLARPYVVAAPSGISQSASADGVKGRLVITVGKDRGSAPIVVGWSNLTLGKPLITGTCQSTSDWNGSASRLTIRINSTEACSLEITRA
jgi:hypothetical protein